MKYALLAPTFALLAPPVLAAQYGKTADPDVTEIAAVACADAKPGDQSRGIVDAIEEGLLYKAGYPASRAIAGKTLDAEGRHEILLAVLTDAPEAASIDAEARKKIRQRALKFSQTLMEKSHVDPKTIGLSVTPAAPEKASRDPVWMFDETAHFQCGPSKPAQTIEQRLSQDSAVPVVGLLKSASDLALTGSDRKKADAATFGVKRTKTDEDDGSSKKDVTVTFDGALGLRLTNTRATAPIFAFANYTLSRDRTTPAAQLAAGKHKDDGDTNGLALGLAAPKIFMILNKDDEGLPTSGLTWDLQSSYVADFVKGSRRAVGTVEGTPNMGSVDLGICSLGLTKAVTVLGITFRSRCYAAGDVVYSHVFKAGRADFKAYGDFLSAGVSVGITLSPPIFAKEGIVASASYKYLSTLSGIAPHVKRVDAALKYRWWLPSGVAFDVGGTYKHGQELKTYTKEDSLQMSFGILY